MLFLFWLIWAINFSMVSAPVVSSPPVLIWGTHTPENSKIFRPLSTEDFFQILKRIHSSKLMIVLYFASELAAKDITCASCFANMKKIERMNYYSQVEKPLKAIQKVGKVIWHDHAVTDSGQKKNMELPCNEGAIYGFNFNDRNFAAQDSAIIKSHYHLDSCPVVHVYSAFEEENRSLERRRSRYKNLTNTKIIRTEPAVTKPPPVNQADSFTHHSVYNASGPGNVTILRLESAILAFNSIVLAIRKTRQLAPFTRSHLVLKENNQSMQVGMYNNMNLNGGMILVLDTDICPLVIELLPVKGNWHFTRVICANRTFYPRDLIFFSSDFSLCCSDITFFATDKSRLGLFNFYLDIITSEKDNGMDLNYNAKPCWSCEHFMTATLTQTLVVMVFFLLVLWIGMSLITSIGRNKFTQVATEPPLYIKADR